MVREAAQMLDSLSVSGGPKYCGGGLWKKAGDSKAKYEGLAISGRVLAGCPHMMVHMAVNMLGTGEKYAYIYMVFAKYFQKHGVKVWEDTAVTSFLLLPGPPLLLCLVLVVAQVVYGDLMCKWHPWLLRMAATLREQPPTCVPRISSDYLDSVIPVVAGLHANVHAWYCQVQPMMLCHVSIAARSCCFGCRCCTALFGGWELALETAK
jgi:Kyakuja-Dileera-Zisupton transposase